jgi:ubiquinone/menaquinone biosynthesis C-methylase UbiE
VAVGRLDDPRVSRPAGIEAETERVRRYSDRQAPSYDRWIARFERVFVRDGRFWVCGQARGRVLEIAAGTGRNLPFYPPGVAVTALDLSAEMLALAHRRAAERQLEPELREGDAQALEFEDESFDAVVCTLGLCTIPDPGRALAEALRVLRPGGLILLLEHVGSDRLPVRALQRLLDPVSVRLAADHLTREPLDGLAAAGFEVDHVERSALGIMERIRGCKPRRVGVG